MANADGTSTPGELRRRVLVAGIVLMAVLATFVDFTLQTMSVLADGAFMAALVGMVWMLPKGRRR